MKRTLKNGLALILCAALLALGLSALLLSCHDCSGETCAVCLAIGEALRLTRAAAVLSAVFAALMSLADAGRETLRRVVARPTFSLISMKTELLN
ncbi:MAG: hypothetical protein IKO07_03350 [Clostridia bacterium]|nr:hypothetical protein [Clostridia bacterium]